MKIGLMITLELTVWTNRKKNDKIYTNINRAHNMKITLWKPEVQRIMKTIHNDPHGWEKLLSLYDPEKRPKKRDERYEQFERLGLNNKWQINKDLFSHGWHGFDQMMINIMTPGFKKKGVAVKENKLDYLETLWLFCTKDIDKKTQSDLEQKKKLEAEERSGNLLVAFFIALPLLLGFFLIKSCLGLSTMSPAETKFMDSCRYGQFKSERECKETWKRNEKYWNE
jgi:hypothetical protein